MSTRSGTGASARIAVIINPISGGGGRIELARARAEQAVAAVTKQGAKAEVSLTERPGHAPELASAAQARGATVVIAWGGDGTVNEVGSVLVDSRVALGIVPAGSGNGLARELGIPRDPERALAIALGRGERRIDVGELDGRVFFNVAGVGFDARVARRFAARSRARRGLSRYVVDALREFNASEPEEYDLSLNGGRAERVRVLLVAIANTRQYGSGALIAPQALPDDGRLDVVTIGDRSMMQALVQLPRLFTGSITKARGVTCHRASRLTVSAEGPLACHVDGEPFTGGTSVAAKLQAAALRVRVP